MLLGGGFLLFPNPDGRRFVFHVAEDEGAGADHTSIADIDVVRDGGIDTKEAGRADSAKPGDHDVRRDKAMIHDRGVVSNMISTPEDDIIADGHKRLDDIVFKDKAMLADFAIAPNERVRADIAGWRVALIFGGLIKARA